MNQVKQRWGRLTDQPVVTIGLLLIMVGLFILMTLMGGSTNPNVLVAFGAKWNPLIQAGQWWRLITPIFLHIGFTHILLNGITLYFIAYQIEALFGHWRYLTIFLLGGIGGNLASFAFSDSLSAGSSTAIFALFGAFLMLGESFWENAYIRQLTQTFIIFVVMNLGIDLFTPGIDLWGHLGGLIAGFLSAYLVGAGRIGRVSPVKRIVATVVLIVGLVWLYMVGMRLL